MSWWPTLVLLPALVILTSCSTCELPAAKLIEEAPPYLGLSRVEAADRAAAPQLLLGFHDVEEGSWRWTERRFVIAVRPPRPSAPATLEAGFFLPDAVVVALSKVTLTAIVDGVALPSQTFSAAGEHRYRQTVPVTPLQRDPVIVRFQLDKALRPGQTDSRELGVIFSYAELR